MISCNLCPNGLVILCNLCTSGFVILCNLCTNSFVISCKLYPTVILSKWCTAVSGILGEPHEVNLISLTVIGVGTEGLFPLLAV